VNVVVVLKPTKLEVLLQRAPEHVEQLRAADPLAYSELVASAETQRRSREQLGEGLESIGVSPQFVSRDRFDGESSDTHLIIALGGDGTILDVSHRVHTLPILGINSDPGRSVGYFCAGDAAAGTAVVRRYMSGDQSAFVLARISLSVDGTPYGMPCMNDILVTNRNAGMMARYVLTAGRRSERQSSSGIWVSTPAGSTAGIRSAGGTVMPLEGELMQYFVREPYIPRTTRYELLRGVRHLREGLILRSLMEDGVICVDGPWMNLPFSLGATLELTPGPSLRIIGMDPELRER
jgi:NAD+ kinase